MRHSTVSAPIESCNASNLNSPTLRFCALHLLHGQVLYFIVEPKSKTKELYNQACAHLASQGMLDTNLFGLAVILDGEYFFVDPDYKLSKYAPKNWRSSSSHGLDSSGKPLLAFYLRVQFYIDSPVLLRDEASRHQYYLQLRHNVKNRNLVYACVAEELIYLLVGLALQADFGDHVEAEHTENYFSLEEYFPDQMVAHGNESRLYQNATVVHKANCTLSKAQAEIQFIREASSRDSFPLAHNSHLYRLKQKKHDPSPGTLWLAICTRGIELYEEKSCKPINGTFFWNNIGKLCFDRKKFEIRSLNPAGERMTYYTSSDEKSKHLLTLCRLTHQFCMAMQTRLNELTRKEEEEKKQYRDWGSELNVKLTEMCYNHSADQRISVISNTSSNTTSGIVSDRVQSLDESEDDLDMEIMINSPPAASLESLALAHLRDSFSKENRRAGRKISQNSPLSHHSSETKGETSDQFCLNKLALPTTPAPTDGSQCSSSCSTVVITGYSHEETKAQLPQTSVIVSNRSHSTTSSLELGYSHTAQNSTLSDSASCCLELDYSVQSAHASSGIYTLQSSCETNTVATTAVAASSETSGIGHSLVEDSEGMRSRSGSIVSIPGSFHGDGSDPSDTGHGTPLTAEELSDLIVGRSPKPCRGKYPSIATVSESLDSVADYVTLPPPPAPPPPRLAFKPMEPLISHCASVAHHAASSSKSSDSSSYVARHGSVSNESHHSASKYCSEEAMLQRQIQFQHLAAGFSSHLLMDALPNGHPAVKAQICLSTSDLSQLNEATFAAAASQLSMCRLQQHRQQQLHTERNLERVQHHKSCTSIPARAEEARVITAKPHINVLRAQSTYAPSGPLLPSYSSAVTGPGHHQSAPPLPPLPQHGLLSKLETDPVPVVGANNYLDVRRSGAAFLQQFHEKFPPPPPPQLYQRQPPPPPPPVRNHYSGCGGAALYYPHQLEQYRQQLYSDVDYVVYPLRDPAISKQEYLDSKEASGHCAMAAQQYPDSKEASGHCAMATAQQYLNSKEASGHCAMATAQQYLNSKEASGRCAMATAQQYLSQSSLNAAKMAAMGRVLTAPSLCSLYGRKTRAMYQSTPNVAMAGGYPGCAYQPAPVAGARYASNQNLSSELSGCSNSSLMYLSSKYPSSTSPLFSTTASLCSSMQSLRQDAPSAASSVYGRVLPATSGFARTRSDDNILNCGEQRGAGNCADVKFRKPPPPPPPPYDTQKSLVCLPERIKPPSHNIGSNAASIFELCSRSRDQLGSIGDLCETGSDGDPQANVSLDISSLREKSKNLDLPLISALCNDKTLLKQTNTVDACCASEDPFETSGNCWYNSPEEPLPEPCPGAQLSATVAAAASYDIHPTTSIPMGATVNGVQPLMATKTLADACNFVEPEAVVLRAKPMDIARSFGGSAGVVATAVTTSTAAFSTNGLPPLSSYQLGLKAAPEAAGKMANHKEPVAMATPLFTKIKPLNAKLSKPSVSTSSKLKYTISQPIQKTVAKVKGSNSGTSTTFVDAKNSFVNRVRCKSSKVRSAELSSAASRSRND